MKEALLAILNEVYKGLRINWHYKFNILNEFIALGINFMGTILLMNYGNTNLSEFGPALVGYIMWVYASYILEVSYNLTLEGRSGTLEHIYMSPFSPTIIFIGSTLSTLVSSTIMITLMSFFAAVICNIHIPFTPQALPVFLLTLLGLFGFSLTIAGATLLYKNVYGFVYLISTVLFYLDGSMLPIENFPRGIQYIANALPTTQGIIVLRKLIFNKETLYSTWHDYSLISLIINTVIYLVLGLALFKICEKSAKEQGRLGIY